MNLIPGQPLEDDTTELDCGKRSPAHEWMCCRPQQHEGSHIASGTQTLAVWDGSISLEIAADDTEYKWYLHSETGWQPVEEK